MTEETAEVAEDSSRVESIDSRLRVNALVESLLDDENLSDQARMVLRHLQETPENLVEMDADELGTVLLEGLS